MTHTAEELEEDWQGMLEWFRRPIDPSWVPSILATVEAFCASAEQVFYSPQQRAFLRGQGPAPRDGMPQVPEWVKEARRLRDLGVNAITIAPEARTITIGTAETKYDGITIGRREEKSVSGVHLQN